jgi:hypothetical protein
MYVSGRGNARNVKNRGYESLHALFVHPDPVCRRIIPVSMHAFCRSCIDGLLGNVIIPLKNYPEYGSLICSQ